MIGNEQEVRFVESTVAPDEVADGWSWGYSHHKIRVLTDWDVRTLLDLHREKTGSERGRRPREGIQVLSRSAIILTCTYWEAFCEDLFSEALEHFATSGTVEGLPSGLKKSIAKRIDAEKHEHAPWMLAGDGWRDYLRNRANVFRDDSNKEFNSPRSAQVIDLFKEVGVPNVAASWKWHKNEPDHVADRLDKFITLRGTIVHRGDRAEGVQKKLAKDGLDLILRLADATAKSVWQSIYSYTNTRFSSYSPGAPLFDSPRFIASRRANLEA